MAKLCFRKVGENVASLLALSVRTLYFYYVARGGFCATPPSSKTKSRPQGPALCFWCRGREVELQTVCGNNTRLPEFSPFRRKAWRNFASAKSAKTSPRFLHYLFVLYISTMSLGADSAPHHLHQKQRADRKGLLFAFGAGDGT